MSRAAGAVAAALLFAAAALWRASLAVWHYRVANAIVDDPSLRELEIGTAQLEAGVALLLALHGVAALRYVRHPVYVSWPAFAGIALAAGVPIGGSLAGVPGLGVAGLLPAAMLVSGTVTGFRIARPWLGAYLGAVAGSVVGFLVGSPVLEPLAAFAVTLPAVLFGAVGVGAGRLARRARAE